MTSPAIHVGPQCKFCPRTIPTSLARYLGNEETGYICPDCIAKEQQQIAQLNAERAIVLAQTQELSFDEAAPDCAMCGKKSNRMILVQIDGRRGYVCASENEFQPTKCEDDWYRLNRDKLGPAFLYPMKLK